MSLAFRKPLLSKEQKRIFKKQILDNWYLKDESGNFVYTAKTLAKKLQFGVVGTPYEKLHVFNLYMYRHEFSDKEPLLFPNRREPPFKKNIHRYKEKQEEEMSLAQFMDHLNSVFPRQPNTYSSKVRSYSILHYNTPLRRGEILGRTVNNFEIKRKLTRILLVIHLQREKKKYVIEGDEEPLSLILQLQDKSSGKWYTPFPEIQEVLEYLCWKDKVVTLEKHQSMEELIKDFEYLQKHNFKGSKWQQTSYPNANEPKVTFLRPWNVTGGQAYHWIRTIFPNGYPHMFRNRFITDEMLNQGASRATVANVASMTLANVEKYFNKPDTVQIKTYEEIASRRLKNIQ